MNPFYAIASVTTLLFLVITFTAHGPSTYRFAFIFLAPMLWGLLKARKTLALHSGHYALLAVALLFHNMGAYGLYRSSWRGIEFDGYVHYFFGFAGGFAVARGLGYNFALSGWKVWVGTVLMILGVSAIHELIEFASTAALGPEKGMLKLNDGDLFDTQKDMLNALLGTLTSLGLYGLTSSPAFLSAKNFEGRKVFAAS
jgi:putative membrane protein